MASHSFMTRLYLALAFLLTFAAVTNAAAIDGPMVHDMVKRVASSGAPVASGLVKPSPKPEPKHGKKEHGKDHDKKEHKGKKSEHEHKGKGKKGADKKRMSSHKKAAPAAAKSTVPSAAPAA